MCPGVFCSYQGPAPNNFIAPTDEHKRGHCPWLVEILLLSVQPNSLDLVNYFSEQRACRSEEHKPGNCSALCNATHFTRVGAHLGGKLYHSGAKSFDKCTLHKAITWTATWSAIQRSQDAQTSKNTVMKHFPHWGPQDEAQARILHSITFAPWWCTISFLDLDVQLSDSDFLFLRSNIVIEIQHATHNTKFVPQDHNCQPRTLAAQITFPSQPLSFNLPMFGKLATQPFIFSTRAWSSINRFGGAQCWWCGEYMAWL